MASSAGYVSSPLCSTVKCKYENLPQIQEQTATRTEKRGISSPLPTESQRLCIALHLLVPSCCYALKSSYSSWFFHLNFFIYQDTKWLCMPNSIRSETETSLALLGRWSRWNWQNHISEIPLASSLSFPFWLMLQGSPAYCLCSSDDYMKGIKYAKTAVPISGHLN